jgi:hypothetical protein
MVYFGRENLILIRIGLLIAFFLGGSAGVQAQSFEALTPETRALVTTWLSKNCDVGEEPVLEGRLRALAEVVEPVFAEVAVAGPPEQLLRDADNAAAARFEQRRRLLDEGTNVGLSDDDLSVALETSKAAFVERQRRDLILSLRSQAVVGLGLTGGADAQRILRELVADEGGDLQLSAATALSNLGPE